MIFSFLVCGILFAAIKTIPGVNAAAGGLLSWLYQRPVQAALDPSDLLALLAFLPAWKLWLSLERGDSAPARAAPPAPGRLAYAALGLGALASLATAPCMSAPTIQRLGVLDGVLYAAAAYQPSGGYSSPDQGRTWKVEVELPLEIAAGMAENPALPLTRCNPANPQACYRISGTAVVEESQDGGNTWAVSWQIPPGRADYLRRVAACGSIDLAAYDLAFVPGPGGFSAVVAVGKQGLLLRHPGAAWERAALAPPQSGTYPYIQASPIPFAAGSLDEAARAVILEILAALGLGFISYLALSLEAWEFAARRHGPAAPRRGRWIFRPLWLLAVWVLLGGAAWAGQARLPFEIRSLVSNIGLLLTAGLPVWIFAISIWLWVRAGHLAAKPGAFRSQFWAAWLGGMAVFALISGSFMLWALGILAEYTLAALLSLAYCGAALYAIRRCMRRALEQSIC